MTVKELMDFLKECPEDANINVKNYIDSTQHRIEELAGFFDGVKDVVNIYISEDQGEAEVARHGHWVTKVRPYSDYKGYEKDYCSLCGNCGSLEYAYCPTCGARMDEASK